MTKSALISYFTEDHALNMTLRDYFAAEAMKPLTQSFLDKDMDMLDPNGWMDGLAMDAYSMADAMLKARET
jgi:hypothetical protein